MAWSHWPNSLFNPPGLCQQLKTLLPLFQQGTTLTYCNNLDTNCNRNYVLSHVWRFAAPWTVDHRAPLPMEFSKQEYWSGMPFPSPGNFPNSVIKLASLASPALARGFITTVPPGKPMFNAHLNVIFTRTQNNFFTISLQKYFQTVEISEYCMYGKTRGKGELIIDPVVESSHTQLQ